MTDTPTPTGGDMTDGITRAHLETPEEIAATPTDIEVDIPHCEACSASGGDLDFTCAATKDGQHVLSSAVESEPVEVSISTREHFQHAKVVMLMVSAGKVDKDRTYEEFVQDIRDGLDLVRNVKGVTETGGYYILDGEICRPLDYDPVVQDRKPGTSPPEWAKSSKSWAPVAPALKPLETRQVPGTSYTPPPAKAPAVKGTPESVQALAESLNKEVKK